MIIGSLILLNWKSRKTHNSSPTATEETTFSVNVLYFAWIAEKLVRESETILLPRGRKNVACLLAQLRK